MKAYWDSSALVEALSDPRIKSRLIKERGISRLHSLSETFSAITGKSHIRLTAKDAATALSDLSRYLDFVELSEKEVLQAAKDAEKLGVRGGRIYDLLHARAAEIGGAKTLLTLDRNDFDGLAPGLSIELL